MGTAILGLGLVAAFLLADRLATRGDGTRRSWVLPSLGLLLAVAAFEMARFDHGHPEWVFAVGFVAAPIVVIFGGAAEGVRRWYGWPDFGPLPGRAALVGAILLAGVLAGQQAKESDVSESRARGSALSRSVREWRDAHGGRWPATLDEAVPDAPTTRMGTVSPPPFAWDPERGLLSFPVRTGDDLVLDVADAKATWRAR